MDSTPKKSEKHAAAASMPLPDRKRPPEPPLKSRRESESDHSSKKPKPNSNPQSKETNSSSGHNRVKASHILIKHEGSRRKASWKDPEGHVISATTRAAAVERLMKLRDEIDSGEIKFEDAAKQHSDCTSAKRGGDLGRFGKGQMQKPFEETAFGLKIGEMSDIVDTDSGVHIILRTA